VFTLVVNVDAGVANGTVISNTATVATTTTDPNSGNESATATTTVAASADLSLTKVDVADPVSAGNNITYTITATNAGPSVAASTSLSDTLPAGTTFVSLSSPGGWSCTTPAVGAGGTVSCSNASFAAGNAVFTLVVNVQASTASGTIISNTATITSTTTDPNTGNESATATTTIGGSADLSLTKVDAADPVNAGENITYTITATNAGPSNAASVSLSDTLPAGTAFVSLSSPGGWSCTTPAVGAGGTISCSNGSFAVGNAVFTLVVSVQPSTASGTVISNTATISSTTSDPNSGNESATATTTISTSADLSLTKSDAPDPVVAGNNITYTITLNSSGPSNATNVALSDSVPANTTFVSLTQPGGWNCTTPAVGATGAINCTIASFSPGSSMFTMVVAVDIATAGGTTITNTASVSASTPDSNSANNSATATTTVTAAVGSADLSITNVDSPDPVVAGSTISYAIAVTNAGPTAATSASLTIPIPANTTFDSLPAVAGWSCTTPAVGATGTVTCTNASFAVGTSNFTLGVRVGASTLPNTIITSTATITSATTDPNNGNESATATTNVISPSNVSGTKSVSGTFTPGSTVTYTITLSNSGPAAQADNSGNELTDVLPSQLHLVSATASSGTAVATIATNTVTWNGSIPALGTVTITITATIDPAIAPGTTITNQGTIAYDATGNGTNSATRMTDDAAQGGSADATGFVVGSPANINGIPALDGVGLFALTALLGLLGVLFIRRS